MAIADLHKNGYLSHVVSQNCDGLHVRSGLPRSSMSEVHGNMYIEVCIKCRPVKEYVRLFDVTERTSIHKHKTGRKCHTCGYDLIDTIVHFGEKGVLKNPLNWSGAVKAADKCKMILCLGSSLKVLRRYTCLWGMDRPQNNRPKLAIVNLQWTPKDNLSAIKINGKCDEVMKEVMRHLDIEITSYQRDLDPIFEMAKSLKDDELVHVSRKLLSFQKDAAPECGSSSSSSIDDCKFARSTEEDDKLESEPGSLRQHNGHTQEDTIKTETSDKENLTVNELDDDASRLPRTSSAASDEPDDETAKKLDDETQDFTPSDSSEAAAAAATKAKSEQTTDDSNSSDNCDDTESDSDAERVKKPASTSVPGWFGKGMKKLPRKRKKL